ncbi:hypothetical protein ACVBEG_27580 [Pseudomonas sp. GG8]
MCNTLHMKHKQHMNWLNGLAKLAGMSKQRSHSTATWSNISNAVDNLANELEHDEGAAGMIQSIADQTNLLANAAIRSSRQPVNKVGAFSSWPMRSATGRQNSTNPANQHVIETEKGADEAEDCPDGHQRGRSRCPASH